MTKEIDLDMLVKIRSAVIAKGISDDDYEIFLKSVYEVAPGEPVRMAQYHIISLLDDKTRDGRIYRASQKGTWGSKFKEGLLRDIGRLQAVAIRMGHRNFLNTVTYWNPLYADVMTKTGLDEFKKYITRPADSTWAKVKDPPVEVWDEVLHLTPISAVSIPALPTPAPPPTPAPKKKKVKPPVPVPTPPPAPAPVTGAGGCIEGAETTLKGMTHDLTAFNQKEGHKWAAGQSVKIQSIIVTGSGVTVAVIINDLGDIASVTVDMLACFDVLAPPAVAPAPPPPPVPTPPLPPPKPPVVPEAPTVDEAPPPQYLTPPVLTDEQESLTVRFHALMREVQRRFMFAERRDGVIFGSTLLIQNGSCLLKGAPGTGKTTLLQMTAMMVSGKDGPEGKDWRDDPTVKKVDDLFEWMKKNQYFGMTQYNADKEPEDIFFKTDISISKEEKEGGKDIERYIFKPEAREIVTSFLKLHNESNRLGPNTADALLGLLAERRVEYKGTYFSSPARWSGHLNYFDYNPHLDTEDMEMDRALLDRIDIGIYLPGGALNTRYEVLKKRIYMKAMGKKPMGLPEDFMETLRQKDEKGNYILNPLTPSDIIRLWDVVEAIPIDYEGLRWITFFTNLGNMTVRVYKEGTYYTTDDISGFPEPKSMSDTYIDPTVMSYKGSKDQMTLKEIPQPLGVGGGYYPIMSTIDAFNRPLGSRAALSLVALMKAEALMRYLTASDKSKVQLAFIVNQRKLGKDGRYKPETSEQRRARMVQITKLLDFLPYVLDHRINIGVGRDIQTNFLNFAHYLRYYFKPQVFFNKEKKYYEEWMDAATIMNELTSKDSRDRRIEWVKKFMEKREIDGDPEEYIKGALRDDPFRMQWYDLAGA